MNKYLKITLIVIGVLLGIVLLDTIQAKVFNNSPVLSFKVKIDEDNYVKKGLLVNTYYCDNQEASSHFKFAKYYCLKNYSIDEINNIITSYMENNKDNYKNYVFNYTEIENNTVVVGLVDISLEKQDEFMTKVFGEDKNRLDKNLIEFKESKETFDANIIDVQKDYIIVEVLESSGSFIKGDNVKVDIGSLKDNKSLEVGNDIKITFNTVVLYNDPAEIEALVIDNLN